MNIIDKLNKYYDRLAEERLREILDMNLPASTERDAELKLPKWQELAEADGAIDADGNEPDPEDPRALPYQPGPTSPRLDDVSHTLGEWTGLILGQLDYVLATLNDSEWKGETRKIVLDQVGHMIVDMFTEGEHEALYQATPNQLDALAARQLAAYIVTKSLRERKATSEPRALR